MEVNSDLWYGSAQPEAPSCALLSNLPAFESSPDQSSWPLDLQKLWSGHFFPRWLTMEQDRISLVDHLDGLIFLGYQARQLPPGRCMYLAYTFRRLGQTYQNAALTQREGRAANLRINYNYILK
jgi:hypothetical protein